MTASDDADLAGLLCSRLCHDLVSPVGAIGNGLELLAVAGAGQSEEYALLDDSAKAARAALAFFRVAFGAAGPDAPALGWAETGRLAADWMGRGRHALDWPQDGPNLPRMAARTLLLMVMAGVGATPLGGRIAARPAVAAPLSLMLIAEGRRAGLAPETTRLVEDPAARPAGSREAHLTLLARSAAALGLRVSIAQAEQRVTIAAA